MDDISTDSAPVKVVGSDQPDSSSQHDSSKAIEDIKYKKLSPKTDSNSSNNATTDNATLKNTPDRKTNNLGSSFAFNDNNVSKNIAANSSLDYPSALQYMSFTESDAKSPNQIANKLLGQREELMQLYMAKRQNDYTVKKSFRIFVGTWNVNGQYPPETLKEWLAADNDPPDIYAIGFQELDLSKEAFVFSESSREEEWVKVVMKSLHGKSRYRLVKLVRLVGMMLLVYVAKKHEASVSDVASHYVGTGLLGRLGNKGAVGIRFDLHSSTFCFVNSHLAAHAELAQRRNEDYAEIRSRMQFDIHDHPGNLTIFQHDFLIWLGDLNYRIDGLQPDYVKELIDRSHYKLLKENDQLLCQKREGKAFEDFEEGEIEFRPTYKYDPGSDQWDTSEKFRTPAWCDRILWREIPTSNSSKKNRKSPVSIHQKCYRSHPALRISDHKPVSSVFDVDVKVIHEEKYRQVYEEEIRRLDRMENDWLPTMTLSCHAIDFGDIKFHQPVEHSVVLHNTGQVPCHYEFIGKFQEKAFCKPWLTISKPKGFIMPDDQTEIFFEVYVNKSTACELNTGEEVIEDILILHLVGGKDFFITVNGKYFPSFFGTPIDVLCQMNKPIREIPQTEIRRLSKLSRSARLRSISTPSSLKVPKELWRILDHLYHNALEQEDLFQQPGLHSELQDIRENLDSSYPATDHANILPGSNHSVVETLLVFLESLPEPVIPFEFYLPCIDIYNDYGKSKELVNVMPPPHRYLFYYLVSFLQELLKHKTHNGLQLDYLSNVFSGLILRPNARKSGLIGRNERQYATKFFENFLCSPIDD